MLAERFNVQSFTAVATYDYIDAKPSLYDVGFRFQLGGSGNFEGKVLASNFDTGSAGLFTDITSSLFGGATFTQAKAGFYQVSGGLYNAIRFSITSVQAANVALVSGSWM